MHFLPPRRWFQFRLSTWFILVVILGWAMACQPWIVHARFGVAPRGFASSTPKLVTFLNVKYVRRFTTPYLYDEFGLNRKLGGPALAVAAFLAWKAAWAVVERRRRQSAAPE